MYPPEEAGERVDTVDGPGTWTGETGQWGEHYVIELESGETARLHYEDIYPEGEGPDPSGPSPAMEAFEEYRESKQDETTTMTQTTQDNEEEHETETEDAAPEYDVPLAGMVARDREDGGKVVVIARTGMTAEEDMIAATGMTVAEHNPEYPADAPTVLVSYKGNIEERWPDKWAEWPASMLTYMVGNAGEATFSFPAPRLRFGPEFVEHEVAKAEEEGEDLPEPESGVSCTSCEWSTDAETVEAVYALHNEACPECNAPVRKVMTDGGEDEEGTILNTMREVLEEEPDAALLVTIDDLDEEAGTSLSLYAEAEDEETEELGRRLIAQEGTAHLAKLFPNEAKYGAVSVAGGQFHASGSGGFIPARRAWERHLEDEDAEEVEA